MRPIAAAASLVLLSCASRPIAPASDSGKPPAGQLPDDVRPLSYAIELRVDPEAKAFSGKEQIEVELKRPTTTIWMHSRKLRIQSAMAGGMDARLNEVTPEGVATLSFAQEFGPGKIELRLEWQADFDQGTSGLSATREDGKGYAATQLEAIDARRVFPCFDEPRFKTPYSISLIVPKDDIAFANTHAEGEEAVEGGLKRVRYAVTAPLPTYLFAIAVGPFDVVENDLPPNEVRVKPLHVRWAAPKGRAGELAFAQKAGDELVVGLERYFRIPFPYDKLDHVAVPGSAGAMENAGLIRYAEPIILYREGSSQPQRRRGMVGTIAHEMAHQWFGDYVTTPWWDEIWLNEAFATWMSARLVDRWNPALGAAAAQQGATFDAMHEDSLASVRRIREPIRSVGDIANAFDGITYQKGAAVIGMFERYVGDEAFREGLHAYLLAHANGSGSTEALLDAWSRASGKKVTAPFLTFLDQPGVPLVEAALQCDHQGARLQLKQSRFVPLGSPAPRAGKWGIPICASHGAGAEYKESCTLLEEREGVLPLPACPQWILPNAGSAGYYHWALVGKDLAALRAASASLSVRERLSLADSVTAALSADALPLADALDAAKTLAVDPDPEVAPVPMGLYSELVERLATDADRAAARKLAAEAYAPLFAKLGWTPQQGESEQTQRLRARVEQFLANIARDPEVRAEAARRGRAAAAPAAPELDRTAIAPAMLGNALAVAVQEGDAAFFDAMMARLKKTEAEEDRGLVLGALASVPDAARGDRVLALVLDKSLRPNENGRPIFQRIFTPYSRADAWRWLQAHWDEVVAALDTGLLSPVAYLPNVAAAFCSEPEIEAAQAFLAPRAAKVEGAHRPLQLALEQARTCSASRAAHSAEAAKLLAPRQAAGQ